MSYPFVNFDTLPVGEMNPYDDKWFYRDSYNQIWLITRESHPGCPLTISLFKALEQPIIFENKGPN